MHPRRAFNRLFAQLNVVLLTTSPFTRENSELLEDHSPTSHPRDSVPCCIIQVEPCIVIVCRLTQPVCLHRTSFLSCLLTLFGKMKTRKQKKDARMTGSGPTKSRRTHVLVGFLTDSGAAIATTVRISCLLHIIGRKKLCRR